MMITPHTDDANWAGVLAQDDANAYIIARMILTLMKYQSFADHLKMLNSSDDLEVNNTI